MTAYQVVFKEEGEGPSGKAVLRWGYEENGLTARVQRYNRGGTLTFNRALDPGRNDITKNNVMEELYQLGRDEFEISNREIVDEKVHTEEEWL